MSFKLRIKPKLIDKYIFRQVLNTTLMGICLFVIIWIAPELLFKVVKNIVNNVYGPLDGLRIIGLELPLVLSKAIPMGLLLGCLAVFDKMSKDFELTIFRSVGVSFKRLLAPVIVVSFLFSIVCYINFDRLIPVTRNDLFSAIGGHFYSQFVYMAKGENKKPEKIIIVSNFNGEKMFNVNVLNLARDNNIDAPLMANIYTAPYALFNGNSWYLVDGMDYKISSDNVYKDIKHFDAIEILSGKKAQNAYKLMKYSTKRARFYTNGELLDYVKLLKEENLTEEYRFHLTKYYERIFQSISCIFLALCGCILGYNRPRETRLIGFTTAVGVIFGYYIIVPLIELLAQKGILFPMLAASIPTLIVIGTIIGSIRLKNLSLK